MRPATRFGLVPAALVCATLLAGAPARAANPHANGHGQSGTAGGGRTLGGHLSDGVVGPAELNRQTSASRTQVTDSPDTPHGGTLSATLARGCPCRSRCPGT